MRDFSVCVETDKGRFAVEVLKKRTPTSHVLFGEPFSTLLYSVSFPFAHDFVFSRLDSPILQFNDILIYASSIPPTNNTYKVSYDPKLCVRSDLV